MAGETGRTAVVATGDRGGDEGEVGVPFAAAVALFCAWNFRSCRRARQEERQGCVVRPGGDSREVGADLVFGSGCFGCAVLRGGCFSGCVSAEGGAEQLCRVSVPESCMVRERARVVGAYSVTMSFEWW